jgi:hypothetical protein
MLRLSLATWDHDRVMALHDGRVAVEGVAFESHILPTGELFPIAVNEARFDVTELSVSSYALQVSRGRAPTRRSRPSSAGLSGIPGSTPAPARESRARRIWRAGASACRNTR